MLYYKTADTVQLVDPRMVYTFLRAPIKKTIWLLALSLIVLSLFLSSPYVRQVKAQSEKSHLTNVYSDYGLDLDGNGLFDYLVFTIEVNITIKWNYTVNIVNLKDSLDNTIFVKNYKNLELEIGVQNVSLYIPGLTLFSSGRDGPYTISKVIFRNYTEIPTGFDYTDLDEKENPHETINSYSYGDFEEGVYASDLATAMGVNPSDLIDATFSVDRIAGAVVTGNVGFLFPTEGDTFVMLSTGNAEPADFDPYRGWIGTPNDFLSNDNENPSGTCPLGEVAYDIATLNLTLLVPEGANSLSFDFIFMSEEYPEWVNKDFNDFFSCLLDGENIAKDTEGKIINVNNNFFDDSITPAGTVFDGTTVLLTSKANVTEGATIELNFIVGDVNDSQWDTAVFLDNFNFSTEEIDEPVTAPTIWACDSSGNTKNTFAPTDAVYVAVPATGKDVAFYIVTDKDVWNDGDTLTDKSDGVEELTLNPSPGIQVVPVWVSSLTPGNYDIVEDTNKNGLYDAGADGIDSMAEVGFTIGYAPPVASFTYSPESPVYTGEVISFDASGSYDPDGSIVSYDWDFGEPGATGSGEIVSYSYADDGVYTVTLTVTDDDFETAVTSVDITVLSGPVHNLDTGISYPKIQEAINADETLDGHTISVDAGTYYENVVVNKSVSLIGEDRSNTIINGSGLYYTGALVRIEADNVDMSGFTVTNAGLEGINVADSRYCEVHENIVCFTGERGIVFANGGHNSAYDNIVYNSSAYGAIEAIGSNNNTIYNNLAYFNQWGIATNHGSYNRIYNNTVYSNRGSGIHIDWPSTGNIVYNNNISLNNNVGISFMNQASENIISNNEITGNNHRGISFDDSSNNIIYENNVTNNDVGIYFYASSNNVIYHNNFVDNTEQVYSEVSTNVWDDGYPSGGNYWSYYAGVDLYSGVNQDVPGADGIGDTPYTIDENNQDNYPLMGHLGSPVASFTYSPESPVYTDVVISFDASGSYDPDGSIVSYDWDFGEPGATGSGVTVTHVYVDDGTYIVTLTVTDTSGNWDTDTLVITVLEVTTPDDTEPDDTGQDGTQPATTAADVTKPVANVGSDKVVVEDMVVSFDAGGSSDNAGIVSYEWDFGDETTGTGITVTHTYTEPGNYTVTLTVKDAAGNSQTDSITVTVQRDTDGDGIPDVTDTDDDNDGMSDDWELENGLDPLDAQDASFDADNDGLTSLQEYEKGTNPNASDARTLSAFAMAVGAFTAATAAILAQFTGLGKVFDSAISKLPIRDELKEFLQLYGENLFEMVDKAKLEALKKAPFLTRGEVAALGVSALIATFVFGVEKANGLDYFLTNSGLVTFIPPALVSACVVIIFAEFFEACCARICRVHKQFRLWMYGIIMFLVSGLMFHFPIGAPGITRYRSGELSKKAKGLFVLSKMLLFLTLSIPFAGLLMLGFNTVGEIGLSIGEIGLWLTLITVFSSLIPLRPLVGKALFDYRKEVSLTALAVSGILLFSFSYSRLTSVMFLPYITYLAAGAVSALLAAVTLNQLRKAHPT